MFATREKSLFNHEDGVNGCTRAAEAGPAWSCAQPQLMGPNHVNEVDQGTAHHARSIGCFFLWLDAPGQRKPALPGAVEGCS